MLHTVKRIGVVASNVLRFGDNLAQIAHRGFVAFYITVVSVVPFSGSRPHAVAKSSATFVELRFSLFVHGFLLWQ